MAMDAASFHLPTLDVGSMRLPSLSFGPLPLASYAHTLEMPFCLLQVAAVAPADGIT
jgi:hypothetical protein